MNEAEILRIFEKTGALLAGHFLLTSGLHSREYFQCARVLQYPEFAEALCAEIASHFQDRDITTVMAPAIGGIIVAHEVARHLGVKAIFSERENTGMTLRRGFEIDPVEEVLVVEDVVTTGGSVREVIDLVGRLGGKVVGVGCLVDRSGGRVDFGYETFSLVSLAIETMPAEKCDLCRKGIPVIKPGSRKDAANG